MSLRSRIRPRKAVRVAALQFDALEIRAMLSGVASVPFGPQPLITTTKVTTPTATTTKVTTPTAPTTPVSSPIRYDYPIAIMNPTGPPGGSKVVSGGGRSVGASPGGSAGASPAFSGPYTPVQIRQAYGFDKLFASTGYDGTGQTIAIIDAFDDTSIASDLSTFDNLFASSDPALTNINIPGSTPIPGAPTFTQVNPEGTSGGEDSGWDGETALDVEWAHTIAPGANILLVEANTNANSDLLNAVKYATAQSGVHQISMSYGGDEFPGDQSDDPTYDHPGISYFASAGDDGTELLSPAISPYVTSVGGTSLTVNGQGNYSSESAWSGSGGGFSQVETRPTYQNGFVSNAGRGVPDVSYDADPNTGVFVVDQGSFFAVGGTSAAAPQWAGLMALANQGRAQNLKPSVGTGFKFGTNNELYTLAGSTSYNSNNGVFNDITTGNNGFPATQGWDPITGLGTPIANTLVPALVGTVVPVVQGAVIDSGFENNPVGTGAGGYTYDPVGLGWTYNGTAGVSGNGSAFTSSNPASPQGAQVGFIQMTGSISQAIPGVVAGTYQIYFSAAQRANYQSSQEDIQILVDGVSEGVFTPVGPSYRGMTTAKFNIATAGKHTITILGVDSAGGDNTVLIDNVSFGEVSNPTPVLGDPSFETVNTSGALGNYVADPTTSAWTFAGTAGVAGNSSAFTTGNPTAPAGSNVAYLEDAGSITQTIAGFAAGTYQVTFSAAQRAVSQSVRQDFEILVDGSTVVGNYTPIDTTYEGDTTATFTLTAGTHSISFVGLDSAGGDNTALIDNVVLSLVKVAAAPVVTALPAAPTLPDAGFETDKMVSGTSGFQADPSGSAWTFSGTAGISGNGTTYTSTNPIAPQGTQVAYVEQAGGFSQSISGWKAGNFLISFQDAQRGTGQSFKEDFEVLIDGVAISTFTPAGTSYLTNWTAPFTVTAGVHTIAFVGLNSAGGDNTALIDGVTIVPSS